LNFADSLGQELGQELFLASDFGIGEDRILIFGRQRAAQMLRDADHWLMDGTFKIQPCLFKQLFTIHVPFENTHHTIPVFYALLPNKEMDTYERLFNEVESFLCE
jgi:hypothetical protein